MLHLNTIRVFTCHMCMMSHLLIFHFLWQNGHTDTDWYSLSISGVFSRGNSSKRYLFALSCNWIRYSMRERRSLSSSCGAWNTRRWVSIAGMRDTAKQDNMIGLCLFFSLINGRLKVGIHNDRCRYFELLVCESKTSFFTRQLVLITIIHQFVMCLYFMVLDSCLWSEEVTELALHVACESIILYITLTKDAMFEIAQVLDVQKVLGNFILITCVIYDAKRHTSSTAIRLVYLRTCE